MIIVNNLRWYLITTVHHIHSKLTKLRFLEIHVAYTGQILYMIATIDCAEHSSQQVYNYIIITNNYHSSANVVLEFLMVSIVCIIILIYVYLYRECPHTNKLICMEYVLTDLLK